MSLAFYFFIESLQKKYEEKYLKKPILKTVLLKNINDIK